jgi:hypothetical protein
MSSIIPIFQFGAKLVPKLQCALQYNPAPAIAASSCKNPQSSATATAEVLCLGNLLIHLVFH